MNKTKIDWCDSTWNPVTGCMHDCEYCYARKIANRFSTCEKYKDVFDDEIINELITKNGLIVELKTKLENEIYPYGFSPTFHKYRLDEPQKTKKPKNIFVCSMADLFGDWVPDEWIEAVFEACEKAPQHNYLFLTKNPKRYEIILDRYYPSNMYFGWSQTGPTNPVLTFETHHSIQTFISIEPLLQPFEKFYIKGLDWVIVGAETGNRKDKVVPKKEWIVNISEECIKAEVPIFMKESLRQLMGDDFIQEFPIGLVKQ
jgi:protein gp37